MTSYIEVFSGVAMLGHTGARALTTKGWLNYCAGGTAAISGVPLDLHLSHLDSYNVKTWDYVAKWHSHRQHTHAIIWFIVGRRVILRARRLGSKIRSSCQRTSLEYSRLRFQLEFQKC